MSLILIYRNIPHTHFFDEALVLFFLLLVFHSNIFHYTSDTPELHWAIT